MQKRTAKNELENKNKHKCKKPKQRRTKRNTSCAFRSLAAQVLRHRRLFFTQKSIKKIIKNQHLFFIVFDRFWDPSWSHLGGQNRPKMGQVGFKTALETIFFEKREFSRNIGRRSVWSVSRAPRRHPKRPKIVPRRPQDGLISVLFSLRFLHRFLVAFWCDFGAILGCFGEALGGPNG